VLVPELPWPRDGGLSEELPAHGRGEGNDADKPVILQFGKIAKDLFTMDYRYPLTAFQVTPTLQYSTVQYRTVQYCTLQYITLPPTLLPHGLPGKTQCIVLCLSILLYGGVSLLHVQVHPSLHFLCTLSLQAFAICLSSFDTKVACE